MSLRILRIGCCVRVQLDTGGVWHEGVPYALVAIDQMRDHSWSVRWIPHTRAEWCALTRKPTHDA